MNFEYPNLFNFLKNRKKQKGGEFTNTTLDGGIYHIPDEDYDLFLKSYSKNIFRFFNKPLSFTEKKIPELGILTIDLDFREIYKNSNENDSNEDNIINIDTNNGNDINEINIGISRKYNLEQIITFCEKISEYIEDFCIDDNNEITKYFIFEIGRAHV